MKSPEGQPDATVFHDNMDDCGYKNYNDITRKHHAEEVRGIDFGYKNYSYIDRK